MRDFMEENEMSNQESNLELGRQTPEQDRSKMFPVKMFVTAGIASAAMVMIISSVFAQANAPCINSYDLQNKVIVDTNASTHFQAREGEPIAICNRNNQQIGWLTWIFKQSESVEFHYLDLLELISRNNHDSAPTL